MQQWSPVNENQCTVLTSVPQLQGSFLEPKAEIIQAKFSVRIPLE